MITIRKTDDKWAISLGYLWELENEEKESKEFFKNMEEITDYLTNLY
jgi:hypothetical protein